MYTETIRSALSDSIRATLTPADLSEIEDVMRHTIFHSTLDWQTRGQLQTAARTSWDVVRSMRIEYGASWCMPGCEGVN